MKSPSYPVWLSVFMLVGPFFMVSSTGFGIRSLVWLFPLAGAAMVMIALFCLSKRLHEQTEEVAYLRQLLKSRDDADQSLPRGGKL